MAAIASVTSYEYAAGTCTLRLVGELSPLSQVTGRPVLGRSRFYLQIHQEGAAEGPGAIASQAVMFETSGREPQFSALAELVQTYVQGQLSARALAGGGAVARGEHSLQPVGLTRHRLTLATPPEPPHVVELSTLQLADLADALDQAEGSLQLVPDAVRPSLRRRPRLPLWVGSVAAVGIAALLGNQLLTNAPPAVVLSPEGPQPASESTAPPPAASSPPAPGADTEDTAPGADTGNRDTGRADTGSAESPQPPPAAIAPSEPATAPAPAASPSGEPRDTARPQATPPPAPLAPAREPADTADTYQAAEPAPTASGPSAMRSAPAQPESLGAAPEAATGVALTEAVAPEADWLLTLSAALKARWRPPANLAAPLRYRLTLAPDGTVVELLPLNDFSAAYQGNAALPQPGSAIPGVARDRSTTVEAQFLPTGEVVVALPDPAAP